MNEYALHEFAKHREYEIDRHVERERLIREAKAARVEHGSVDFIGNLLGALGFRAHGLKPAMNPGH